MRTHLYQALPYLPYILTFTGLFLIGISVIYYRRRAAGRRRIQERLNKDIPAPGQYGHWPGTLPVDFDQEKPR